MNLKTLLAALLVAVAAGCHTSADEQTVLHIGKYKLTKGELQEQIQRDKYKSVTTSQALANQLVEEGTILAYAIDHRYDTISKLNKLLHYATRAYAAKVDGFVWNKKVKPKLQLTEKDIEEAYAKRAQEYVMETVLISNKTVLDKYYKSADDFELIRAKASPGQGIRVFNLTARFPFYPFSNYTSQLNQAKAGDMVGPFETPDGYVIARVAAIKQVAQKPYEQEKENVKQSMLFALTEKYMMQNQMQIFRKAAPDIDEAAVKEITQKYDARQKLWPGVDPALPLMTYNFQGRRVVYRVSDFKEFVDNEPVLFGSLQEPKGVKDLLLSTIIEQYMLVQAQQMNMQANQEYLAFKKQHQEDFYLEHYKRTSVYPGLTVTPAELDNYYNNHKPQFNAFEAASVSVYKFNSSQEAFRGKMLLLRNSRNHAMPVSNNTEGANPALPQPTALEIQLNASQNNIALVKGIMKLLPGQVSYPIKINDDFWVVQLLAKRGTSIIPYPYVKDDIEQVIHSQKMEQLNKQAMASLKARYPVLKNETMKYITWPVVNNSPMQQ